MRRILPVAFVIALLAVVGAVGTVARVATADGNPTCIRVRGEVRYGALAYNHVVHIANGCTQPADCVVSTNVNPTPQNASVDPQSEIEVVTFLGSPAREFSPRVTCKLRN